LFGVFPLTFLSICVLFQSADDLAPREKRIMTQVSILIRPRLFALVMLLPFHQQGIEGGCILSSCRRRASVSAHRVDKYPAAASGRPDEWDGD
jgi:hypothetical protein